MKRLSSVNWEVEKVDTLTKVEDKIIYLLWNEVDDFSGVEEHGMFRRLSNERGRPLSFSMKRVLVNKIKTRGH